MAQTFWKEMVHRQDSLRRLDLDQHLRRDNEVRAKCTWQYESFVFKDHSSLPSKCESFLC